MGKKRQRKNRRPASKARWQTALGAHSTLASLSLRTHLAEHSRHALVVFIGLLVVYLITMPRVVTYEDAAIFNLICHYGQPAHPPGYPLYSLLCYPFVHLPFLSVPLAGNLLSGLFGAAACVVLYLIAVSLTGSHVSGYLAGFGYGLSKLFWSQSIIQEVYSLHALLFFLMLLLALAYVRSRNPVHLKWFVVFCGLGISNHWVLTILSWPALLVLLLPAYKDLLRHLNNRKNFGVLAALFLLPAVLPYAHLLSTNLSTSISFYGPLKTFDAIIHYVSRTGYSDTDNQQISWFDKVLFARFVLGETAAQYGTLFLWFSAGGFLLQWKRWRQSLCWALVLLYLTTTYLLVWLVNFRFTELWMGVFSIYPVVAYGVFALWGALAIDTLIAYLRDKIERVRLGGARIFALTLLTLVLGTVGFSNLQFNYRAEDRFAFNYAKTMLELFDKRAAVLLVSDFQLPIMELHFLEKVREDLVLFNVTGLFLSNRYISPNGSHEKQDLAAARFLDLTFAQTNRPIYYYRAFEHAYGVEDFCVFKQVREDWPAGKKEITILPELLALWEESEPKGDDLHFDVAAKRQYRACMVGMIMESSDMDPELRGIWQAKLTDGGYYDLLSLIRFIAIYHKQPPAGFSLEQLVAKAERMPAFAEALPKDQGTLLYAKAFDLINRMSAAEWKDSEAMSETIAVLRRSLAIYPSSENPAAESLIKVLDGLVPKGEKELEQLRSRYPFKN